MNRGQHPRRHERLVALFVVGCLLFSYPLMDLFSGDGRLFGLPVLWLYVFIAWFLVIIATGLLLRRGGRGGGDR
ncbi:MAG: hypothetical protein JJT90_07510 [Ectothiorhodospiraceae bacterium]|nr:hypothetical protein [Ectothiorhodospiraceae bacterium]